MDKQKNASEFSNNISADDLLKKLKENIDSVSDDELEDTDPLASEMVDPLQDVEESAFVGDMTSLSDDGNAVSEFDSQEGAHGLDSESSEPEKTPVKPLQIQHRYKFRRSTRIKTSEQSLTQGGAQAGPDDVMLDGDELSMIGMQNDDGSGISETAKLLLSDIVDGADLSGNDAQEQVAQDAYFGAEDGASALDMNTDGGELDDRIDDITDVDDIDDIDEASAEKIENLMKKYMSENERAEYLSDSAADTTDNASDVEDQSAVADDAIEANSGENYENVGLDSEDQDIDEAYTVEAADEEASSTNDESTSTDAVIADDTGDAEGEDVVSSELSEDEISDVVVSADEAEDANIEAESEIVSEDTSEGLEVSEASEMSEEAEESDNPLSDIFNEDFDETDANLMLAFGMEEELERSIGKENVDKISENLDKQHEQLEAENAEKEKKKEKEKKPEPEEVEYTAFNQTKEILNDFKAKYKNATYRMLAVAVAALLLFFFENIGIFGGSLPEALDNGVYPVVHILIDFQLLLLCFLPAYHILLDGFKALIALKPNVNSILSIVASVSVIYALVMCFISTGMDFHMYGFPVAMCVLLALINERLNLQREVYSFNVVSSRRPKYVLDRLSLDQSDLEKEAFYNVLPENPSIFKIEKTSFVNGFFRRTKEYSKNKIVISAVIPASIVIAIITFIIALFVMKSASSAFFAAYLTFMLCMPFSMLLTYSLPCCKASKDAYKDESAFVGESALDEYTTASSISFDDKDVFPAGGVKVKSVKVFGNNRIDYVIYNVASVFSALGGPLSSVLDIATMDMGKSDKVELLDISNDGIEALVDDQHMLVGKANYLRKNRFVPISDPDDEEIESTGGISIMYLVCDNEIAAKIYVEYHIDPDFEYILKKMYRSGICVGIKTVDPNIDDEMLGRIIRLEKYPVRVLKCREAFDDDSSKEGIDSGIVSKRSTKALLKTFTLCDKVQHITKANIIINAFAALIGIMISAFIIWLNIASGVFSIYVFMYQLFWILPIYVTSRLFI